MTGEPTLEHPIGSGLDGGHDACGNTDAIMHRVDCVVQHLPALLQQARYVGQEQDGD